MLEVATRHDRHVRLRGTVVGSFYERGLPWASMDVGPDRLKLQTPMLREVVYERADADSVEVWTVRVPPFGGAKVLAVKLCSGDHAEQMFIPWRRRRTLRVLRSLGWPVTNGGRRRWGGPGRP